MVFEWNEVKNRANVRKHGVSFELASLIFHDAWMISILDKRFVYHEERFESFGVIRDVVFCVSHTCGVSKNNEEKIRIISARRATSREEWRYYADRGA